VASRQIRREPVPSAKTVTGQPFEYDGTLATGITVFFKPPHKKKITPALFHGKHDVLVRIGEPD
jgi:hypothetical protein